MSDFIAAREQARLHTERRLAAQSAFLRSMTDAQKEEAFAMIRLWESKGTCSSRYCVAWRAILSAPDPVAALQNNGEWLNAMLQNSPLPVPKDPYPC